MDKSLFIKPLTETITSDELLTTFSAVYDNLHFTLFFTHKEYLNRLTLLNAIKTAENDINSDVFPFDLTIPDLFNPKIREYIEQGGTHIGLVNNKGIIKRYMDREKLSFQGTVPFFEILDECMMMLSEELTHYNDKIIAKEWKAYHGNFNIPYNVVSGMLFPSIIVKETMKSGGLFVPPDQININYKYAVNKYSFKEVLVHEYQHFISYIRSKLLGEIDAEAKGYINTSSDFNPATTIDTQDIKVAWESRLEELQSFLHEKLYGGEKAIPAFFIYFLFETSLKIVKQFIAGEVPYERMMKAIITNPQKVPKELFRAIKLYGTAYDELDWLLYPVDKRPKDLTPERWIKACDLIKTMTLRWALVNKAAIISEIKTYQL